MGNSSSNLHEPDNNTINSIDYSEMSNNKYKKMGRFILNKSRKLKNVGTNLITGGSRKYKVRRSSRCRRNIHSNRRRYSKRSKN